MSTFNLKVQELRSPNREYVLSVKWHHKIKDIKKMLQEITSEAPRNLDLFYGTKANRLSNDKTLHDFGIDTEGHTLRLTVNGTDRSQAYVLQPSPDVKLNVDCERMLSDVAAGLQQGIAPRGTGIDDCTGGVYFMRKGKNYGEVAVFKPLDEEQGMQNNGHNKSGNGQTSLRPNFLPGQGCIREVAAYIMDVDNFAGVPPTTLVHCEHPAFNYPSHDGRNMTPFPKLGSLQGFVRSAGCFEEFSPSLMSDFEVQKIALLDMRLLNCDRNASNILVKKKRLHPDSSLRKGEPSAAELSRIDVARSSSVSSYESAAQYSSDDYMEHSYSDDEMHETAMRRSSSGPDYKLVLVPIDHGYSLPTKLRITDFDWEWFNLPHIKRPVHPRIREYLLGIDFETLMANLTSQVAISEDSLYLLRLSHNLLVEGVEAGLTLYQIACMIARLDEDKPSLIEDAIVKAEENAFRVIHERSARATTAVRQSKSVPAPPPSTPFRAQDRISIPAVDITAQSLANANANDRLVEPKDFFAPEGSCETFPLHLPLPEEEADFEELLGGGIPTSRSNNSLSDVSGNAFGIGYVDADSRIESDNENDCEVQNRIQCQTDMTVLSSETEDKVGLTSPLSPNADSNTSTESSPRSDHDFASKQRRAPLGSAYGLGVGTGADLGMPLQRLHSVGGGVNLASETDFFHSHTTSSLLPKDKGKTKGLEASPPPSWGQLGVTVRIPTTPASTGTASAHTTPLGGSGAVDGFRITANANANGASPPLTASAAPTSGASNLNGIRPLNDAFPARRGSGLGLGHRQGLPVGQSGSDECLSSIANNNGSPHTATTTSSNQSSVVSSPTSVERERERQKGAGSPFGVQVGHGIQGGKGTSCSTAESALSSTAPQNLRTPNPDPVGAWGKMHLESNGTAVPTGTRTAHSGRKVRAPAANSSVDTDSEEASPNEDAGEQKAAAKAPNSMSKLSRRPDLQNDEIIPRGGPLMRVTSFTAFSSEPLYDSQTSDRRVNKLSRDKRKAQASTSEFQMLRKDFTLRSLHHVLTQHVQKTSLGM